MLIEAYAETYDMDYGPFLVGIADEEKVSTGSLFSHRAKEYRDYGIEKFGLSLLEYIGLPRPFIDELKVVAEETMKSDVSLTGEVHKKLSGK